MSAAARLLVLSPCVSHQVNQVIKLITVNKVLVPQAHISLTLPVHTPLLLLLLLVVVLLVLLLVVLVLLLLLLLVLLLLVLRVVQQVALVLHGLREWHLMMAVLG